MLVEPQYPILYFRGTLACETLVSRTPRVMLENMRNTLIEQATQQPTCA